MTVSEIRKIEHDERIEYKNACLIGKYLEGQLKPSDEYIIRRLKNEQIRK